MSNDTANISDNSSPEAPADTASSAKAIPEHRENIQVAYKFTLEETIRMGFELRTALNAIDELEDQKKDANDDFKLRIQNRENETKMIRKKLDTGEETRPMRVAVDFDSPRSMKRYLDPSTGAFIREERMSPADWQLPLFRTEEPKEEAAIVDATFEVAGEDEALDEPLTTAAEGKIDGTSPVGAVSMGDVLDKASATTQAPQFVLDLTNEDWAPEVLLKAFRRAAKAVGWSALQVSTIADLLRGCDSVAKMLDTLRPHVVSAAVEKAEEPTPTTDPKAPATAVLNENEVMFNGMIHIRPEVTFGAGFPAAKYRAQFRVAAVKEGWKDGSIDAIDEEALAIETRIGEEPEAGNQVREFLSNYCTAIAL